MYGVRMNKGVEPMFTFCQQRGEESIFLQFCANVFYRHPLKCKKFFT